MRKRILFVDDDVAIRSSIEKVLTSAGYDILLAADACEANEFSGSEQVNLLLLDLNLPPKSGWELLEKLAERYSSMPILVITAFATEYETALSTEVGAVMEKPVDPPALLNTIEELLAESTEQRAKRLRGAHAEPRFIPSSNTQLLKKLRERAATPFQFQPHPTTAGARIIYQA